jgi:hypothetical protein
MKKTLLLLIISGILCLVLITNIERFVAFTSNYLSKEVMMVTPYILLGLVIITMFVIICIGIVKLIKTESNASKFRKEMKIGDSVYAHIGSNINSEVSEIDNDFVTIKTKVSKHLVYPYKNDKC